jgi:hypothetical protein
MQPVDVCWARAVKTEYGRYLRTWLVPDALQRAYWQLPPAASIRRRTAARDSRACIAVAAFDAARGATSTFNASHAFSAAGLVPFNAAKPPASQYVRDCEEGVERAEEAKHPGRIHTGSRVLTSADFLAFLTVDEDPVFEEDEGVDVDLLEPKANAFEKLTAETEQVDPAAPEPD